MRFVRTRWTFDGKKAGWLTLFAPRLKQVIGTYGIALVHARCPDFMIGARRGSPLVLGVGKVKIFSPAT
jgi:glucosamine 6-phosphate synthetase-like amidotransferase/phosphosugar isomerase protein